MPPGRLVDSSLALASLAAASASSRARLRVGDGALGVARLRKDVGVHRVQPRVDGRRWTNTHARRRSPPMDHQVARPSNGFVPSPTARNAPHVSIQRAYAALVATAAVAAHDHGETPFAFPDDRRTPRRRRASSGRVVPPRSGVPSAHRRPRSGAAPPRVDAAVGRIVRPSGKTTSSPRTSAPRRRPARERPARPPCSRQLAGRSPPPGAARPVASSASAASNGVRRENGVLSGWFVFARARASKAFASRATRGFRRRNAKRPVGDTSPARPRARELFA